MSWNEIKPKESKTYAQAMAESWDKTTEILKENSKIADQQARDTIKQVEEKLKKLKKRTDACE